MSTPEKAARAYARGLITMDEFHSSLRLSAAEQRAAGHKFRATERVPGWCVRCGGAEFVHAHESRACRPETCGGIDYDPCEAALSWWECACGFDAKKFEPRPESVPGAIRWHKAVCKESLEAPLTN